MEFFKGLISGIIAGLVLALINCILPSFNLLYQIMYKFIHPNHLMMIGSGDSDTVVIMFIYHFTLGFLMMIIYLIINSGIPGKGIRKGFNYGILIWLLTGLFPLTIHLIWGTNVFIILILLSGLIGYSIVGAVIAVMFEKMTESSYRKINNSTMN